MKLGRFRTMPGKSKSELDAEAEAQRRLAEADRTLERAEVLRKQDRRQFAIEQSLARIEGKLNGLLELCGEFQGTGGDKSAPIVSYPQAPSVKYQAAGLGGEASFASPCSPVRDNIRLVPRAMEAITQAEFDAWDGRDGCHKR